MTRRRNAPAEPHPRWSRSACAIDCEPSRPTRRGSPSSAAQHRPVPRCGATTTSPSRGVWRRWTTKPACVREVLAAVAGYGPLQPYLDDPTVEELWINAPDRIFVARGGVSERTPLTP